MLQIESRLPGGALFASPQRHRSSTGLFTTEHMRSFWDSDPAATSGASERGVNIACSCPACSSWHYCVDLIPTCEHEQVNLRAQKRVMRSSLLGFFAFRLQENFADCLTVETVILLLLWNALWLAKACKSHLRAQMIVRPIDGRRPKDLSACVRVALAPWASTCRAHDCSASELKCANEPGVRDLDPGLWLRVGLGVSRGARHPTVR